MLVRIEYDFWRGYENKVAIRVYCIHAASAVSSLSISGIPVIHRFYIDATLYIYAGQTFQRGGGKTVKMHVFSYQLSLFILQKSWTCLFTISSTEVIVCTQAHLEECITSSRVYYIKRKKLVGLKVCRVVGGLPLIKLLASLPHYYSIGK